MTMLCPHTHAMLLKKLFALPNSDHHSGVKLNTASSAYTHQVRHRSIFFYLNINFLFSLAHRHPPGLAHISSAACRATLRHSSWSLAPSRLRCHFLLSASSCPSARSALTPQYVVQSPKTRSLRGEVRGDVFA